MKIFLRALRAAFLQSRLALLALLFSVLTFGAVAYLYRLPTEPFLYASVLLFTVGAVGFSVCFFRQLAKAKERARLLSAPTLTDTELPRASSPAEEDYRTVLLALRAEIVRLSDEYEQKRREDVDYYTVWVHQIKTPISVLRMQCAANGAPPATEAEVFRIEQYVDMVLQYIRIGSGVNDLVVREYSLDGLVRESVRKFASSFVAKRLTLDYAGTDATVVTDKKWFSCLIDQLLSNAIKYTPSGTVTLSVTESVGEDGRKTGTLSVTDTGIGIPPEDIGRIFEKGYTGENGRLERKSSGLGLYLAKKAADLLSLSLSCTSTVGVGTTFCVCWR